MRIHTINGKKTAILTPLETLRIRSISVASIKVQNLEADNASFEEVELAKEYLADVTNHFNRAIRSQGRKYRK